MLFEKGPITVTKINNVVNYEPKFVRLYTFRAVLPTYEILYFHKGKADVKFLGKDIHLEPGDILYLPKGVENDAYTMDVTESAGMYNVYFDTTDDMPKEPIKIKAKNKSIEGLYQKVYRAWRQKRQGYYYFSMQQVYAILEILEKTEGKYFASEKERLLLNAESYIAECYCDMQFDYQHLAECSGLSYSYFKKLFIEKYGCPPVKYITQLKIERACELLQAGKFSVSEVAELCGFENVYYFSNVFKKCKGVSPKNYK